MIHSFLAVLALAVPLTQRGSFDTDTTFSVPSGARLIMQNVSGDVRIRTWDRSSIRLQASHSSRTAVGISIGDATVRVAPRSARGSMTGAMAMVDYELTIPAAMSVDIGGLGADVTIEDTRGDVKVNTVEGDIRVQGGSGLIALTTVNGQIAVRGARARLELKAVSDDIDVEDVEGDLIAETVSGDLRLIRVEGRRVEAQTVSGDVTFTGSLRNDGNYTLITHSGDVVLGVPEGASATIATAIGNGDLSASFSLPSSERASRRRQLFRIGGGSASVELETFSGDIRLVRPTEIRTRTRTREER